MNDNLSWDDYFYTITAKGNKILETLKRTRPLLTNSSDADAVLSAGEVATKLGYRSLVSIYH